MCLGSGIRDPGSGKNLFRIPDPGSRGQKGTGSGIPDPDPQHCFLSLKNHVNVASKSNKKKNVENFFLLATILKFTD
jgi:hypothetical protein